MMTMTRVNGDFAHWRSMARTRVRDTALQRKMQLQGDDAPQHRVVINRGRKNTNKIRLIQEMEFNIIDIIRAGRPKSVLRCGNSPQIGVLTPPLAKSDAVQMRRSPKRIPEKKFPTPPSYEVLT